MRTEPAFDEFAARFIESCVAGRREPSVRLVEVANAGIGVPRDDLASLVGRAIVNDDYLEQLVRLSQDALDGLADDVRSVIARDDHTDETGHAGSGHEMRGCQGGHQVQVGGVSEDMSVMPASHPDIPLAGVVEHLCVRIVGA